MGSCWPQKEKSSITPSLNPPQPKTIQIALSPIIIDQKNTLFKSYKYKQQRIFQKIIYDWKSIPIITEFDFKFKGYFQIRNKGIKQNNFVVGIIKKAAISKKITMPWKTQYCICYQSHQGINESGIIHAGSLTKMGQGIKLEQTLKVIVSQQSIEFKINKKSLGKLKLPYGFLNDEILPYVGLFNIGDQIQFINQVSFSSPDNNIQ